jgi:C1A family cysteine protease/uncharacterized membrane protein
MKSLIYTAVFTFIVLSFGAQEKRNFRGLIVDSVGYQKSVKSKISPGRHTFPKSFSLLKYAPPVQSQGNMGTCVGWAIGYCAASTSLLLERGSYTPYSPYCVYNRIKSEDDPYCQLGSSMSDAMYKLYSQGSRSWKAYVNECIDPKDYSYETFTNRMDYEALTISVNDFKDALTKHRPIPFSIAIYANDTLWGDSFEPNEDGSWAPDFSTFNKYSSGHAMCIIGYDDDQFGGAFLVQNSWGNNWGKDGYFWMPYNQVTTFDYDAWNEGREPTGNIFDAYAFINDVNYTEVPDEIAWDYGSEEPENYPDPFNDEDDDEDDNDYDDDDDDYDDDEVVENVDDFTVYNNTDNRLFISIAYETYDGWISEGWWPVYGTDYSSVDVSSRISDEIYYRIEDADESLVWSGDASRTFCTSNNAFLYTEDKALCSRKRDYGLFEEGAGSLSISLNAAASRDINAPKYAVTGININPNADPVEANINWNGTYTLMDPVNRSPIINDASIEGDFLVWIVNSKNKPKEFIGSIKEIKDLKQLKFSSEKTAKIHVAFLAQGKK